MEVAVWYRCFLPFGPSWDESTSSEQAKCLHFKPTGCCTRCAGPEYQVMTSFVRALLVLLPYASLCGSCGGCSPPSGAETRRFLPTSPSIIRTSRRWHRSEGFERSAWVTPPLSMTTASSPRANSPAPPWRSCAMSRPGRGNGSSGAAGNQASVYMVQRTSGVCLWFVS